MQTNTSSEELVVTEQRCDGVTVIQLNRPDVLNALSPEMMSALIEKLDNISSDGRTRVAVISGHDRAFVAGADIKSMQHRPIHDVLTSHTAQFWFRLAAIEVPLIAAVSGPAFGGGCELALACDMIVASDTAQFSQAEIKVGIMPGGGGTQRLARTIGKQRAMEMVLTGEPVSAFQAREFGFVNRVVEKNCWRDEAIALATKVASGPPLALRLAKKAVQGAEETAMTAGMSLERRLFEVSFATDDRVEGMTSFIERRKPVWLGR
ncbi:MAG: enoyl-CoA hydratase [Rhodococcus sp. (in: high G+C Gram-positive bacteria)]|uniref:enoyl-CoA hydratase/isomerase family protein n=1 Tax=Rhodococcus sp. TaxID=1831 RepID=UPI00122032D8|nr:enoyl-CoA hydratase-related protein [Rhodococcus sp. (in: high G+C Gram-positive bacteria)]RZL24921.1 MAG: enoyl-CoA hydratase [Rhodococcus sp. (in: high G+C Gram-positive bacteria)]